MAVEQTIHNGTIQIGTFSLGSQVFGVDILRMREIIRPVNITKVPRAEGFIEGVINLRGIVIPVINLRLMFGMPPRPMDKKTRIINMNLQNTTIGFVVDVIGHVHRLPADSIEPAPTIAASIDAEYIAGIAKTDEQLIIILNADKLASVETL
jgi:purine-binding chemotaxis protein CheW